MYQQNFYNNWSPSVGPHWSMGAWGPFFVILVALLIVWEIAWKGIALWKSARAGSKVWFVVLLVLNTVGILPILYIYVFSKKSEPVGESPSAPHDETKAE